MFYIIPSNINQFKLFKANIFHFFKIITILYLLSFIVIHIPLNISLKLNPLDCTSRFVTLYLKFLFLQSYIFYVDIYWYGHFSLHSNFQKNNHTFCRTLVIHILFMQEFVKAIFKFQTKKYLNVIVKHLNLPVVWICADTSTELIGNFEHRLLMNNWCNEQSG